MINVCIKQYNQKCLQSNFTTMVSYIKYIQTIIKLKPNQKLNNLSRKSALFKS